MLLLTAHCGSSASDSTFDQHVPDANGIVQRNALGSDYVEGSGNDAGIALAQSEQFEPNRRHETSMISHLFDLLVNPGKSALSGEVMNFQCLEFPKVKIVTASRCRDSTSQSAIHLKHFQEVSHSIVELGEMVQD